MSIEPMTVGELIDALTFLPPDLPVFTEQKDFEGGGGCDSTDLSGSYPVPLIAEDVRLVRDSEVISPMWNSSREVPARVEIIPIFGRVDDYYGRPY